MEVFKQYSNQLVWFSILMAMIVITGCGGSGGGSSSNSGSLTKIPDSSTVFTEYSLAGVSGITDEAAKTISVTLPSGTDVTAQVATFTTNGTGVKVGSVVQTSSVTPNNFTAPVAYTVTAVDGSTATYTVTVRVAATSEQTITSYSLSGSAGVINEAAKTISVTVPSGTNVAALVATFSTTGTSVKVGTIVQSSGVSVNNFTTPVAYIVTAADGSTATYTVTVAAAASSAKALSSYSFAGYTGSSGVINEAAKTISVTVPNGTNVTALAATFTTTGTNVKVGTTLQSSGVTLNNFTTPVAYIVTAADGSTATYTVSVAVASSTAKALSAYSFAGYAGSSGVINEAAKTISVTVPSGTNVSALVATFTTTGTNVKVGTVIQTSTATANNFTNPVAYIVTAADGSTATYTVSVSVAAAALSTTKAVSAYSFASLPDSVGVINEGAKTIAVSVLPGTDKTALVSTFSTTGNTVKVGTTVQTSGVTPNNFTAPLTYTVTAADASTALYTVNVTTGAGPSPVALGTAGNFTILTKAGISTTGTTAIVGDIGVSPIAAIGITGFALSADASNTFSTSSLVTGKIYAANYAPPTPANMTTAVSNMEAAYTDAAGRTAGVGPFLNLGGGTLTNQTLSPGVYTWGSALTIPTNLTFNGGVNDVWILQVSGTLGLSANMQIILAGGAQAKNIFWQVSGAVTLNPNSHFEGIVLAQTSVAMQSGATINGRLLAQTAVTLDANTVTQP